MSKISKKSNIEIVYRDGKRDTIPGTLWDGYDYIDQMFVITKKGRWVYAANKNEIMAIAFNLKMKKHKK